MPDCTIQNCTIAQCVSIKFLPSCTNLENSQLFHPTPNINFQSLDRCDSPAIILGFDRKSLGPVNSSPMKIYIPQSKNPESSQRVTRWNCPAKTLFGIDNTILSQLAFWQTEEQPVIRRMWATTVFKFIAPRTSTLLCHISLLTGSKNKWQRSSSWAINSPRVHDLNKWVMTDHCWWGVFSKKPRQWS